MASKQARLLCSSPLLYGSCRCQVKRTTWSASQGKMRTVSRGLLDSYRQEQGTASPDSERKPPKQTMWLDFTDVNLQRHPRDTSTEQNCRDGEDDSLCTPECVREILTAEEFDEALESANPNTLIVVDFYKTACGSCRYIQPGFVKLCHTSEEEHAPVVFLKHNVIDKADQETDLSEKLKIRNVPLFQFYKDNCLLEQFATREKKRIGNAINGHVGRDVCHV